MGLLDSQMISLNKSRQRAIYWRQLPNGDWVRTSPLPSDPASMNYYIGLKGFRGKPPEQNETIVATVVATAVVEDPEGVIRCPICKDFTTESAFGLQAHLRKHVNESRKKEVKQT